MRNLPDGSVEALFQGEEKKIEEVLAICKKGPFLSDIESVDNIWEEQTEQFNDFTIRHDF